MRAIRSVRLAAFALAVCASGSAFAGGPALVVDADTGKVLHAEKATDPWFPASITKLMTTYVALSQIRSNQVSLETLLTVSEGAAAQPPSKMGFKPGTQIRLDNALKILMVKSANDVASTIAENLGGSIEGFSELMNQHAAMLGMRNSHFANPHGLPDERNQTTARDMAILATALIKQFPDYNELFHIGAIQYGRRIMRNTNGLIGRYPGADGMKTGFICSAGFNVVATATRNGRHLITVVMGAPSANERTMKAAELFDRGFNNQPSWSSPSLAALPASASTSPPDMRSVICDRRGPMPNEEDSTTTLASPDSSVPNLFSSEMLAFAGGAQPLRTSLGPRSAVQPERVWIGLNPPSETEIAAEAAKEAAREAAAAKVKKAAIDKGKSKGAKDTKIAVEDDEKPAIETTDTKGKTRAVISVKPISDKAKAAEGKATPASKSAAAKDPSKDLTKSDAGKPDAKAEASKPSTDKPAAAAKPAPKKTAAPAKPKAVVE